MLYHFVIVCCIILWLFVVSFCVCVLHSFVVVCCIILCLSVVSFCVCLLYCLNNVLTCFFTVAIYDLRLYCV